MHLVGCFIRIRWLMNNDMEDKRQTIHRTAQLCIRSLHRKVWPLRLSFIVCLFAQTNWATDRGMSFTTTRHVFLSYFWNWMNDTNTQYQSSVKIHHVPSVTAVRFTCRVRKYSIRFVFHSRWLRRWITSHKWKKKTCSWPFTYAIFGFKRNLHNHVERVDLSGGVPSTTRWGMSVEGRGSRYVESIVWAEMHVWFTSACILQ